MFGPYDVGALFLRIFFISWASYLGYYLCRKNFSVLMPFLKSAQGYSSNELANVLFVYSLAYMLGQFLMGPAVDRFGSRLMVTSGMVVSAAMSALTGSVAWLGLAQSANGLAQSSGWPGLLKLTRDWFPQEKRGVAMAWWCTNMVLGGFMATSLAAFSVGSAGAAQGAWRRGAWIPSLILVGIAAAFLLLTKDKQSKGERPADGAIRAPLDLKPPLVAIALMSSA
jgi:sugar phosphate permease